MRVLLLFAAMVMPLAAGCGSGSVSPVPVTGKVSLNGKPVDGAVVTFLTGESGGRSASGRTNADGTFKLTTNRTDDGAPPGEYAITITKVEAKSGGPAGVDISKGDYGAAYGQMMGAAASGNMSKVLKDLVPAKYGSATNSGLNRTVVKGEENVFDFDLK